ncbi:MAG TPA: hypothetical protein VEA37_08490, partial [Flavobacterium sp.]|nr:hypothetical protein [Flavobacterium sp.]
MKMEPNKLEKEFREKLEKRTIQPSEMAWDRLDAMLSVAEKKKKPNRAWLYMAASFLVFATLGVLFLGKGDSNDTIIKQDAVVNQEQPLQVNAEEKMESIKHEPIVVKRGINIAEVKPVKKTNQKSTVDTIHETATGQIQQTVAACEGVNPNPPTEEEFE